MTRRRLLPVSLGSLVLLGSLSCEPGNAVEHSEFTAPTVPVLMVRELRSPLADGREVVGRRTFAVTFVRQSGGWRVDGRLLRVDVEAPPSLQPLAELERQRSDSGLFPLFLDHEGHLIPTPRDRSTAAPHAIEAALSSGGLRNADTVSRHDAQPLLRQIAAMPLRSPVPESLFALKVSGDGSRHEEVRAGQGHVTIDTREQGADSSGQLRRIERVVTTQVGASTRTLREIWLLSRA